jgi:protein involved in polysaccharide export with SLBB domain
MPYRHYLLVVMLAGAACSSNPPTLPVGQPGNVTRTRAELEQLLRDHEAGLESGAISEEERQRSSVEAEQIRSRLQYGDFRVGDRISLSVEGEADVPDTVTVAPGQVIELPLFGEISVAGVLRSEIRDHLRDEFSAFIRDPVVRANGLMRVTVVGAVGNPGFYTMPAETVLGQAIMVAGGPSGNANLDQVRIHRGPAQIMDGPTVRLALQQGLTLDQLNLQAGDQIEVPQRRGFLAIIGIASTLVGTIGFLLWRVF